MYVYTQFSICLPFHMWVIHSTGIIQIPILCFFPNYFLNTHAPIFAHLLMHMCVYVWCIVSHIRMQVDDGARRRTVMNSNEPHGPKYLLSMSSGIVANDFVRLVPLLLLLLLWSHKNNCQRADWAMSTHNHSIYAYNKIQLHTSILIWVEWKPTASSSWDNKRCRSILYIEEMKPCDFPSQVI